MEKSVGVDAMEHFLVLTNDVEETRNFYCDAMGMRSGFRPKLDFAGYWMYLGDTPVVHIAEHATYVDRANRVGNPISSGPPGTGAVDHIAFNCSDYDGMKSRFEALGVTLSAVELSEIGLRQLFLTDPNGVTLELNFYD